MELEEYRKKIANLDVNEQKLRDLYLRKLSLGEIQGPNTRFASLDKPWLQYYSENAINLDTPNMSAYDYMIKQNQDNLNSIAISYYGTNITFANFINMIDKVADCFYASGIYSGDVVSVISLTNPELEIAFYALNKIGAIINVIDARSDSSTIRKYLEETDSRFLISMDNFLETVNNAIVETKVKKVITISPFNSVPTIKKYIATIASTLKDKEEITKINKIKARENFIEWNDFIKQNQSNHINFQRQDGNNLAALVHTGGTTGVSKTVKLSNYNFNAMVTQFQGFETYKKGDTFLNDIVPFVAYGLVGAIHMPLSLGLTNIIAPIITPEGFTNFMIKTKPNNVLAVPTYWEDFIKNSKVNKMDLSFLKHPGCGGDSMSIDLELAQNEFFKEHNSQAVIELGYGMTEVSSAAIACVGDINKIGSVGIPFVGNNAGIFAPGTEEELALDTMGEVYLKSDTTMVGYLNNEEEEKKVVCIHSDGSKWVHSGDLGYIDKDGFLFLKGRIKRMIIRGGFKIYPAEIEKILSSYPLVEQCCVVAVPSLEFGSEPQAHIILKENIQSSVEEIEKELRAICLEKLPEYSQPYNYIFRTSFPLTSVGKIDYKALEKEQGEAQKVLKK